MEFSFGFLFFKQWNVWSQNCSYNLKPMKTPELFVLPRKTQNLLESKKPTGLYFLSGFYALLFVLFSQLSINAWFCKVLLEI